MCLCTHLGCPLDAAAEQFHAVCAVIPGCAFIESLKVDGVLEGAILDETSLGDVFIVLSEAHDEAEADLGVRVELAGAELDDVSQTLGGTVEAVDAFIGGGPEGESIWVSLCVRDLMGND